MNRKPIFFTSDWHIGHEKAIMYDERPFNNLDHMHESLIKRYNSTVPYYGICYFVGDMGNKTEDLKKVVSRLNGTKVLVWGNHDKGVHTMYNCGFDVVVYNLTLYIAKQRVTISHCPLRGVFRENTTNIRGYDPENPQPWHGANRPKHQQCTVTDEGQFHLHGHIHSRKNKSTSVKTLGRQYDVGVTANNYTPVSESIIESWIDRTLKDEESNSKS